jgi:hypothetical protein
MARSAMGTADFAPVRSSDQRLNASAVFETSFWETKALEAVRVNGQAGRDVLGEEGTIVLALKSGITAMPDAPRSLATLLHRY